MKVPCYYPYVCISHMYGKEEHQVVTSLQNMRDKTQTIKKFKNIFVKYLSVFQLLVLRWKNWTKTTIIPCQWLLE